MLTFFRISVEKILQWVVLVLKYTVSKPFLSIAKNVSDILVDLITVI